MEREYRRRRGRVRPLRKVLVVLAGVSFVAAMILVSLTQGGMDKAKEPIMPHGVALSQWSNNGQHGQYVLQVLDGTAPAAGRTLPGVVINDTHCTPDARGLSHCHNVIALEDGRQITVINTHTMKRHHCLESGERVSLRRINVSWVKATLL